MKEGPSDSKRRDIDALSERIYQFALRVIKVADALPPRRVSSRVVGWQLVKAGTSTASNYEEARGAMSRKEFVSKLAISYRESRETAAPGREDSKSHPARNPLRLPP